MKLTVHEQVLVGMALYSFMSFCVPCLNGKHEKCAKKSLIGPCVCYTCNP